MLTIVGALISVLPLIIAFVCLQRFWRPVSPRAR